MQIAAGVLCCCLVCRTYNSASSRSVRFDMFLEKKDAGRFSFLGDSLSFGKILRDFVVCCVLGVVVVANWKIGVDYR